MQKLFSYLNRILGCTDNLRGSLEVFNKGIHFLLIKADPSEYEKFSVLI